MCNYNSFALSRRSITDPISPIYVTNDVFCRAFNGILDAVPIYLKLHFTLRKLIIQRELTFCHSLARVVSLPCTFVYVTRIIVEWAKVLYTYPPLLGKSRMFCYPSRIRTSKDIIVAKIILPNIHDLKGTRTSTVGYRINNAF